MRSISREGESREPVSLRSAGGIRAIGLHRFRPHYQEDSARAVPLRRVCLLLVYRSCDSRRLADVSAALVAKCCAKRIHTVGAGGPCTIVIQLQIGVCPQFVQTFEGAADSPKVRGDP